MRSSRPEEMFGNKLNITHNVLTTLDMDTMVHNIFIAQGIY